MKAVLSTTINSNEQRAHGNATAPAQNSASAAMATSITPYFPARLLVSSRITIPVSTVKVCGEIRRSIWIGGASRRRGGGKKNIAWTACATWQGVSNVIANTVRTAKESENEQGCQPNLRAMWARGKKWRVIPAEQRINMPKKPTRALTLFFQRRNKLINNCNPLHKLKRHLFMRRKSVPVFSALRCCSLVGSFVTPAFSETYINAFLSFL